MLLPGDEGLSLLHESLGWNETYGRCGTVSILQGEIMIVAIAIWNKGSFLQVHKSDITHKNIKSIGTIPRAAQV